VGLAQFEKPTNNLLPELPDQLITELPEVPGLLLNFEIYVSRNFFG